MNLELEDKTALVIGASSGIGAATARLLAEEGADVVLTYARNWERAAEQVDVITTLGRRAWSVVMDVTDPGSMTAVVEQIKAEVAQIDIVIFCAGHNVITPLAAITPQEWQRVMDVNLNGAFYAVQAVLPLMPAGSAIVTVASVAAHTGAPHHMHYAAAKAGLINLTKSLARALGPKIRVNCVAPGITLTEMGADTIQSLPENYADEKLLVGRYATPEEIARCIVFVACPITGFMTGATIDVNGGRDLR